MCRILDSKLMNIDSIGNFLMNNHSLEILHLFRKIKMKLTFNVYLDNKIEDINSIGLALERNDSLTELHLSSKISPINIHT